MESAFMQHEGKILWLDGLSSCALWSGRNRGCALKLAKTMGWAQIVDRSLTRQPVQEQPTAFSAIWLGLKTMLSSCYLGSFVWGTAGYYLWLSRVSDRDPCLGKVIGCVQKLSRTSNHALYLESTVCCALRLSSFTGGHCSGSLVRWGQKLCYKFGWGCWLDSLPVQAYRMDSGIVTWSLMVSLLMRG